MNLYELGSAYQNVKNMVDDLPEDVFLDTLSAIKEPLNDKAENIARFIKNLEAEADVYRKESQKMTEKATARTNKAKRMKMYLQESLELAGLDKVKGDLFTVAIQNNPQSVEVLNENVIPKNYFVEQNPKLDKKALLASLKQGEEIAGVELKQSRSLRIR